MQTIQRARNFLTGPFSPMSEAKIRYAILGAAAFVLAAVVAFLVANGAVMAAAVLVIAIPVAILMIVYPFSGIIIWLIIMPFSSIFPDTGLVNWVIYRLFTPFILVLVLLYRTVNIRAYPRFNLGPTEMVMGGMFLIVPATILLSPGDSYRTLIQFGDCVLLPFCMYLVIRLLGTSEREIIVLQWAGLFLIITQSIVGALSWVAPHVLPAIWRHMQGARTTGTLVDADLFATMLIFGAVQLIHGAFQPKSQMVRLPFFGACGLSAIFVFLSLERAAWLGGIFVTIGLVFLYRKAMLRLLMAAGILAALLGMGLLSTHIITLSADRFSDAGPIYDRLVVMDAMVQMFEQKPVFGWGYGTIEETIQPFYRQVGEGAITRKVITSHNTFMTLIAELGLVGFLLYMFPLFWWLILSVRVWGRLPREGLLGRNLLGIFWLSLLFNFTVSNFIDMRYFPIGLTHWWMMLGLIADLVYPHLRFPAEQAIMPSQAILAEGR